MRARTITHGLPPSGARFARLWAGRNYDVMGREYGTTTPNMDDKAGRWSTALTFLQTPSTTAPFIFMFSPTSFERRLIPFFERRLIPFLKRSEMREILGLQHAHSDISVASSPGQPPQ